MAGAKLSELQDLLGIINTVKGSEQSQTQFTNISDQGITELLRQVLSGEGGVADIGNSARVSGIYNSTTQDLLLGNLYALAANKAELARSATTTSTDTDGADLGDVAGTIVGGTIIDAVVDAISGGDDAGDAVGDVVGAAAGATGVATGVAGTSGSGAGAGATTATTATTVAGAGTGAGVSSLLPPGTTLPGVGGILSGFVQGKDAVQPESLATTTALGAAIGGPIGAVAAIAGTGLGVGARRAATGLMGDGNMADLFDDWVVSEGGTPVKTSKPKTGIDALLDEWVVQQTAQNAQAAGQTALPVAAPATTPATNVAPVVTAPVTPPPVTPAAPPVVGTGTSPTPVAPPPAAPPPAANIDSSGGGGADNIVYIDTGFGPKKPFNTVTGKFLY